MKFNKLQVLAAITETKIIPVFYNQDPETSEQVMTACYKGGIRVFEFTNRGDFAHEIFGRLVKFAQKNCPQMILGAGSIIDAPSATLFIQSGANFIVSPLFNHETAKICNRRLIPYIPGCGTVTEVGNAQEVGCDMCKVFPGDVLGTAFIKGMKAPMPWTNIMVTGGVQPEKENLEAWFKAGATCVGMGSNLFPKEFIAEKKWDEITRRCHTCIDIAKNL